MKLFHLIIFLILLITYQVPLYSLEIAVLDVVVGLHFMNKLSVLITYLSSSAVECTQHLSQFHDQYS